MNERAITAALTCAVLPWALASPVSAQEQRLEVQVSWGHTAAVAETHHVAVSAASGLHLQSVTPYLFEDGDRLQDRVAQARGGAGDVDGLTLSLSYTAQPPVKAQKVHVQWAELIANSDANTAVRLGRDAAFTPGRPALTVQLNSEGTLGFTVTVDQLLEEGTMWIPSLDVYITAGSTHRPFAEHMRALEPRKDQRILDQVRTEPEATYAQYTARWEDMGDPGYINPHQQGPGHIVGLTWDSAIRKFGIDRAAGVHNDYGNPDKFRFWFAFGDLDQGVVGRWQAQQLHDGLPIMTTTFERDTVRYEVEQFAYPLNGPPEQRRGDMPMVLMQRVTLRNLEATARTVPVSMSHWRQVPPYVDSTLIAERHDGTLAFRTRGLGDVLLSIDGVSSDPVWSGTRDLVGKPVRLDATIFLDLPASGAQQFIVKVPSPVVSDQERATLSSLDYAAAREATIKFWSDYVARGAQFTVPDKVVNDLFRASLWHALRLPRRHGSSGKDVRIDLPYSNFAYGQTGTPWPVNQAVYVDYMLYDLRGYHAVSAEELEAQYRNNQEADGHVNGYANWLVYTPSMLYTVAQHYLLSNDRESFERLLPQSLNAMDWCLGRLASAADDDTLARGLVRGPLNDNTGEGLWAFNQAYLYAGLDLFGRALEQYQHPRAGEARQAASAIHEAIGKAFGAAAVRSPLVSLRDGTWTPYVPAEALTPGRLLHEWYPTDVDTGATHLLRLKALPAQGVLADALLNDHEDNLYYKAWGMAQEPIYVQQATAYLLRDEPEAVVRAFYSYLASAFSHSVLEPVEHRWGQGQYFGPPSTDGAWFELYRNMLVQERDDDVLVLGQATPRAWLRDGERIEIARAPTYYGELSATYASRAQAGEIQVDVRLASGRRRPSALHVRVRHPDGARMQSVTVNGQPWTDIDADGEWVKVPSPAAERYVIVAHY